MAYDAIQEWIKDLEKEFRDLYGPGGEYGDSGVTIDPDGRFGANPQYEAVVEAEEDSPGMYAKDRTVPPPSNPSIWDSPDDQMYYGPKTAPVIPVDPDTGKVIVEAERIPWQGNPHKDQDGWGTEPAIPSKANVKKPDDEGDEDDYLNQLLMSALMAGGKKGKMGQLGGAAGGGIPFGEDWTMQAPWEKDYRYLS